MARMRFTEKSLSPRKKQGSPKNLNQDEQDLKEETAKQRITRKVQATLLSRLHTRTYLVFIYSYYILFLQDLLICIGFERHPFLLGGYFFALSFYKSGRAKAISVCLALETK